METQNIELPKEQIVNFCRRWKIVELALFGSALHGDFNSKSDIDILVSFAPEAEWGLFEHVLMERELTALLGRKVDLLTKRAVGQSNNAILREEILSTSQIVYASR